MRKLPIFLIFTCALNCFAAPEDRYAVRCERDGTIVTRIYSDGYRMSEDYRRPDWATAAMEGCEAVVEAEARARRGQSSGPQAPEPEAAR